MSIIIPEGVRVHTHPDPVSDYLHCACVFCLHNAFPPLLQPIVYRQAENIAFYHRTNFH